MYLTCEPMASGDRKKSPGFGPRIWRTFPCTVFACGSPGTTRGDSWALLLRGKAGWGGRGLEVGWGAGGRGPQMYHLEVLGRPSELCCLSCSCRLSMDGQGSMAPTPRALPYYVAFSQLLGLTVVAMTGAWLGLYRGGIAWESVLQFNVHPLCMVIGLVFLQGDGESPPSPVPTPPPHTSPVIPWSCSPERRFADPSPLRSLAVR